MDIHSFNKKLNKIAALADNGNADGIVSSLERDLLLSYIRELYDIALDEKPSQARHIHKDITPKDVPDDKRVSTPAPSISKPAEEHIPVHIPEEKKSEPEKVDPPVTIKRQLVAEPEISSKPTTGDITVILAEIFADEKITALSDKLSLSHINDLTKSMGINERIFTQQELFGNDQGAFNDTLLKLNSFQNFEDAKRYLTDHIITKYAWTNESKVKKAATFVRLIKRKYT